MNLLYILGLISSIALLVPVALILILGLSYHKSFVALLIYYVLSSVYILLQEKIIPSPPDFIRSFGLITNLLDAPLMLIFLLLFGYTSDLRKRIRFLIFFFLLFETAVLFFLGFNVKAITVVLGLDLAVILFLSVLFFIHTVRLTIMHQKGMGKSLMISSILISYTIFGLIYIFYYLLKASHINDALILYFIVSLFSALLMSIGIVIENKRIKKLTELKITRKELASLYGESKAIAYTTTIAL
jgi:hypothetical protein